MIYKINIRKKAVKVVEKWEKSNPKMYAKFRELIADMQSHPRTGIGHPEPLVGGKDITYSRHISAHDRVVYDIYDDIITILIIKVEEHYNDK